MTRKELEIATVASDTMNPREVREVEMNEGNKTPDITETGNMKKAAKDEKSELDQRKTKLKAEKSELDQARAKSNGEKSELDQEKTKANSEKSELDQAKTKTKGEKSELDQAKTKTKGEMLEIDQAKTKAKENSEVPSDLEEKELILDTEPQDTEQTTMRTHRGNNGPEQAMRMLRGLSMVYDGVRHAVKPLSGSTPSVRAGDGAGGGSDGAGAADTTDGKPPSKARQKKFQRHFPQVGPEERVLNYYSCALVGDLLLQGHLYITKNYFAFYSNVFGYVTKLLIPITSVLRITKEKVARIIPNAVGVCTRDERHVFGSLLSRDSTYKLMTHVWKAARVPELATPKPPISEVELDASEYSPEDDSSSGGGGDQLDARARPLALSPPALAPAKRDSEPIISTVGAAVIQPALLTGSSAPKRDGRWGRVVMMFLALLLTSSALLMTYRLYQSRMQTQEELLKLSGEELYTELMRWRTRLHGRAANELHAFLTTNLLLLTKVRQSLEALSGVILTDMAHVNIDVPNDTAFS